MMLWILIFITGILVFKFKDEVIGMGIIAVLTLISLLKMIS